MKKDFADITILLDRSGSMSSCTDSTINGFNQFIEEQRTLPGEAKLSLVQFDDQYEPAYSAIDIKEVEKLSPSTFKPRGSTALIDAFCRSIDETGKRLESMPENERPESVIFTLITDGYENASKLFNKYELSDRVNIQQDKFNWKFVFLGANIDAIATAASYGINPGYSSNYQSTAEGMISNFDTLSSGVRCMRSANTHIPFSQP